MFKLMLMLITLFCMSCSIVNRKDFYDVGNERSNSLERSYESLDDIDVLSGQDRMHYLAVTFTQQGERGAARESEIIAFIKENQNGVYASYTNFLEWATWLDRYFTLKNRTWNALQGPLSEERRHALAQELRDMTPESATQDTFHKLKVKYHVEVKPKPLYYQIEKAQAEKLSRLYYSLVDQNLLNQGDKLNYWCVNRTADTSLDENFVKEVDAVIEENRSGFGFYVNYAKFSERAAALTNHFEMKSNLWQDFNE